MHTARKPAGKKAKRSVSDREKQNAQVRPTARSFELAIGKMIINFAHLEGIIAELICNLAVGIFDDEELRRRTSALIGGQSFNQLLARLSAQIYLAAPNNAKVLKQLGLWVTQAEGAAAIRNRFAHQQLVFRNNEGPAMEWALYKTRASKKGFSAEFCPATLEELTLLNLKIDKLTAAVFDLIDALIQEKAVPVTVRYRLVEVDEERPPPWQRP